MTRRAVTLAVVLALATPLVLVSSASASTANSGVYAIAPKSAGWCQGWNNYVTYVHYVNYTTGDQYGDYGDDIVWMRVRNYSSNSVNISVQCRWTTPVGLNYTIYPTRYGQSWWFSLSGGSWHN